MIVVDANQIAYLLIGGEGTEAARQVLLKDPEWAVPLLWRSEFRSILAQYMRRKEITLSNAIKLQRKAEQLVAGREYLVSSELVLRMAATSKCTAYDSEYLALAQQLHVSLVTTDRQILSACPSHALSPKTFLNEGA
ncbi:MAG: type II toxin-antitoxin system VapC family toxin [Candidatus Eisenbacteria bacterium]|nr:type II toxin-antitoxin system VapC family toxin [Candidatus Eisenbacteria bacterium]